jgi:hypothetical protein
MGTALALHGMCELAFKEPQLVGPYIEPYALLRDPTTEPYNYHATTTCSVNITKHSKSATVTG